MSKAISSALLGLVESDDEDLDILGSIPATHRTQDIKMPPAKRGRPAAANRITKPVQNATRFSGKPATVAPSNTIAGRKALSDKTTNTQLKSVQVQGKKRPATDDIEMDDAEEDEEKPKAARGRPRTLKVARLADAPEEADEAEPQPTTQPAKRGRKPKARATTPPAEAEIQETQFAADTPEIPETQLVEPSDDSIDNDLVEDLPTYSRPGLSSVQRTQHHVAPFSAGRRPGAGSDSELNDPSMRRRIGDLTRKYDDLEAKYKDLREIGVKEAERNYDRLRKQGEERTNTANQLIATLKAQLAAQTELAKQGQRVKQQLEASESKVAGLQNKVTEMTASLSESKTEIKTLSTRLANSRVPETATSKIPGSAIKGNAGNNRVLANAEAVAQVAQLKEDLYGDLTGLIIRGVKPEKNGEVYDCIQTGRNGTLHFKLSVGTDDTSDNFDETQFMYMPQLDPSRDQDLVDLLPDYLVEEITFPRPHAAKFYSRVMKSLTERLD